MWPPAQRTLAAPHFFYGRMNGLIFRSRGPPQQGSGSQLSTQLIMILQPNDEWSALIGWHCENTETHFRGHKTDVTGARWSINKIDTLDNNNNGIDAS